uniref:Si:dkeyp-69b9.3 n=1 Tax=Neogobius melanostomus TaxID=47308 RepID=A0A8C6SWX9_9GOBI
MKKLKYHQYIPPDQRGGPTQSIDPAYSHLVKQQQVILQLQILQNQQQQQHGDAGDPVKTSGAMPLNPQPVPATTNHTPVCSKPVSKPEFLPANLVDLTVSELRQQLRKRGLPVSGTKPALLQRLRPFQLPQLCVAPAPLCQLGTSETVAAPLSPNHSPISTASSGSDSPSHLAGEQCSVFIAPASTASGTPSPSLPMSSSSPLQCGTPWRTDSEQQQQQQEELTVELEMRERIKSRPRDHLTHSSQHIQVDCSDNLLTIRSVLPLCPRLLALLRLVSKQVYSCQPCDVIGQDFELPVQITASPVQTSPAVRSLEEELQEAIQKAQMDPRQSIDDILDEPITLNIGYKFSQCLTFPHICLLVSAVAECVGTSTADLAPSPSPLPQTDLSQASQPLHRDDNFLPSPLCSSLLLEMPPSPAVIPSSHVIPGPPLLPTLCASPLSSRRKSRKRRAPPLFDAAEWLETLTCGLRPLTPPAAPFVEPDFSLDADLNVNRVLDLMIEQW